jgi:hypothetical protein
MTRTIFIAAALAFAATLPAMPAQAAAGRTFVSAAGSDTNPCTITLPCRNLQAAYNAVAANGEVDVLDPGNYGALTITGPVNIQGHGWAGMSANTGAAITINSPGATDKIAISGVALDGLGITGTNGIAFTSGGNLTVRDSVIRNFSNDGILFQPSASSQLFVSNTLVSDNGGQGISISPSGSGTTNGVLNRVEMENNALSGLVAHSNSQTINVTVSDSVSANNANAGISSDSMGGAALVTIMVRNSTIANNGGDGLEARNVGATVSVTRSTITGNTNGWDTPPMVVGGGGGGGLLGVVSSYADNNIDGNANDNTEPPNPLTYK